MFLATRIANGIVALFAVSLAAMFIMQSYSSTILLIGAIFAQVGVLYGFDLLFRKKNSSSDVVFTVAWMLLFWFGLLSLWMEILSRDILPPEFLFFDLTFSALCAIPLLLNSIYLSLILTQRKT
jgi:hypothetical protein